MIMHGICKLNAAVHTAAKTISPSIIEQSGNEMKLLSVPPRVDPKNSLLEKQWVYK